MISFGNEGTVCGLYEAAGGQTLTTGGDSGGPVTEPNTSVAVGMVEGNNCSNGPCLQGWFTPITSIMSKWGLTLDT
jgi:hypothetical protein